MRIPCVARGGLWLLAVLMLCIATRAWSQQSDAAADRQYRSALGLYSGEAYDLAAKAWPKFITDYAEDPRVPKAWYYLGVCQTKQDKQAEAVKAFETSIAAFAASKLPEDQKQLVQDAYLELGVTQYNIAHRGNPAMYDTAAATFATLATTYPTGKRVAEAIYYEGECLYNRGKKAEAVAKYAVVVEKHPDSRLGEQATFALASTKTELGQHADALKLYDQFAAKYPQSKLLSKVSMWRGESLFDTQKYTEAAAQYAAAAAAEGFDMADYATVRQADSLAALKKYAEAASLYATAATQFPQSQYKGLCELEGGKQYYLAADMPKSQALLGKVVQAGGKPAAEAGHWLARSLLKTNKPTEALAVVEKVLPGAAEGPSRVSLLMDQADAAYEIPQRRGESIGLYVAFAQKYPDDRSAPQALYMASFAAMNAGDHAAALTHADAFLAAHANDELAVGTKHVKAESCLLLGKYAEAEKLYGELLAAAPGDRDAEIWKVHLGTALYLQRKYAETVAALQPVVTPAAAGAGADVKTPALLAEAWYRIGRSQVGLKQYAESIKSLETSLAAEAKWKLADDTCLVLAYAYQQTRDFDKAKENAQKVVTQFPNSKLLDMAHYRLAECSRLTGDLKTASAEYQTILKTWPDTTVARQALYGLGWAQVGLNDFAAAEQSFTTMIDKFTGDALVARAKYGRGMARRQLKKYAPAAEDIEAFLASNPPATDKSRARHALGLCQKGLDKHDQAEATLAALLKEDPGYDDAANATYELGWAQKLQKKEAEAAATFAKLAVDFPDHSLAADSHYMVGDYEYAQKEYAKAGIAYHAAMTKAGKTKLAEEAAYRLGLSHYYLKNLDKAQKAFNYQRLIWPEGAMASDGAFMEAECLMKQAEYQKALDVYALVTKPSSEEMGAVTLLHSSQAAEHVKQWDKSLQLATECVTKYPKSSRVYDAMYQQGWAQKNLGKPDEALKIFTEVDEKSDGEAGARSLFMIGEIQFERKQHEEAIVSFIAVAANYGYPKVQADATYEAARCFEVLKRVPQAIKQYQKLVDKFPQSDKVSLAKERLTALKGGR